MRVSIILFEKKPLKALHGWQNKLNDKKDVQNCSQGAWDNQETVPAVTVSAVTGALHSGFLLTNTGS